MKAEERKELKSNTLVQTLERVKTGLKEGPSRRTVVVLGIILLVVLLIVVWTIASNMSASRNSKRWEQLQAATDSDDLKELAEKYKNTVQGRAARLQLARDALQEGLKNVYDGERSIMAERLGQAAREFEALAKDFKGTPILVQECLFGAAQAREALGEFDAAGTLYEDLAKRWPDSLLTRDAEANAKRMRARKDEMEKIQAELKKDDSK